MYKYDEEKKKIDFSHNPFSMPQISIKDFDKTDPLSILAYQYNLVYVLYVQYVLVLCMYFQVFYINCLLFVCIWIVDMFSIC